MSEQLPLRRDDEKTLHEPPYETRDTSEAIFTFFCDSEFYPPLSVFFHKMILLLIVLSTVVFLLASLPRYKEPHPESEELTWIEAVTCIIFTIEYIPKLLLCSFVSWECSEHCLDIERPETAGRCSKFWYFLFDPLSLVDLP
eukprot:UN15719